MFFHKLKRSYSQVSTEDGSEDEKVLLQGARIAARWRSVDRSSSWGLGFAVVSGVLNVVFLTVIAVLWTRAPKEVSNWASLTYDTPRPWKHETPYSSTNLEEAGALWDEMDIDVGLLALTDEYVDEMELPISSGRFPWDNNKSIYYISGFHELHCIKSVYMSISEWNLNQNQSYPLEHITHCLDDIRDSILCHADDTPRFASYEWEHDVPTQWRMCRSWDKLTAWAAQPHHSACYRYMNESSNDLDQHERYKFCTKETGYVEIVRDWFRKHYNKELPDY